MKVLLLCHTSALGGASRSLTTIVRELLSAGCQVRLLAPAGPTCDEWNDLGASVSIWNPPACFWLGAGTLSFAQTRLTAGYLGALVSLPSRLRRSASLIRKLVDEDAVDVVHVNSVVLFPLGRMLEALRRGRNIRVIWHIREVVNPRLPAPIHLLVVQSIVRASHVILAITSNEAEVFGTDPRVRVLHNTVSDSWFRSTGGVPLPQDRAPRVLMGANLVLGKGIPDFLKMARLLTVRLPEAEFFLYTARPGTAGRFAGLLWRLALNWSGLVRLFGNSLPRFPDSIQDGRIRWVFGQGMTVEDFRCSDVYVRADEDGFPWGRDIIEAMCAGVPVVATGSSQEFVLDGKTGFLVPPGRPDLLAERVAQLLSDAELRTAMAEAARARALQLFSPELYREKLLSAFGLSPLAVPPRFPEQPGS